MPEDIEDDCQEGFLRFPPNRARATKCKLAMEIQELAYKTTQLEILVKENTNTIITGFNQLFMLMNELLQDQSKQLKVKKQVTRVWWTIIYWSSQNHLQTAL